METAGSQPDLKRTRPSARGKFLWLGDERLLLRGVTYGPFRPESDGCEYHDSAAVERDFTSMAAAGINAVRLYTAPPRWLLDLAAEHRLWVLVGLPWEQHVAFLAELDILVRVEEKVRAGVRTCAGHPALLGFAVGNEIPAPVVRWFGAQALEKFIHRLYRIAKAEDPQALVTYVNYPSTEYLDLPFLDLFCFNVYLETAEKFSAYFARLQNLAADKPLLLTESGMDSRRNGEVRQAETLDWQVRLGFEGGAAGVFIFSWTDEWYRGGEDILDWNFGLTRRDRKEKPSLASVRACFSKPPFAGTDRWPCISVIVCTYRGVATLEECLRGLQRVDYPDFEVIVVNDSADAGVEAIARKFPFRLINQKHSGLSAARNAGCAAATGEIVAYLDDDAWPDPHWLKFLAHTFMTTDYAAVGGPNIPPGTDSFISGCVAHAPGGPIHVLLSDTEAEHIPGCNMAIRRSALTALGGFDPQFWVAGDDVDMCWRIHEAGWKIGYHPGAMVWHHRRKTIFAYLKQQSGYGRAEAILERKWPANYNAAGQPAWHGRIYGFGRLAARMLSRGRIYHGTWGSALFQSLYEPAPSLFWAAARMPEWYMVILALGLLIALAPLWHLLAWVAPLLVVAIGIPVTQAVLHARRLPLKGVSQQAVVALLCLLQPAARLRGRVLAGLTPWGRRRLKGFALPLRCEPCIWSEKWMPSTEWLGALESALQEAGAGVFRGGDYDRWDLEVRGGVMGGVRLRLLAEDHGGQKQNLRFKLWPHWPVASIIVIGCAAVLAAGAGLDGKRAAAWIFATLGAVCLVDMVLESAAAMALVRGKLAGMKRQAEGRCTVERQSGTP